jgi:transcriptional regulator with XRE-family HTH domain
LRGGWEVYEKFLLLLKETSKTAYQVSKDTGISTATLTNWKQGNYQPKTDKLKTLADYFGVTVDYFLE